MTKDFLKTFLETIDFTISQPLSKIKTPFWQQNGKRDAQSPLFQELAIIKMGVLTVYKYLLD